VQARSGDVTDPDSVAELVGESKAFGTVASVIHTAGVSPSMGSAEQIIRINALGTVNVNEAFTDSWSQALRSSTLRRWRRTPFREC
jgi:nucleoside-diphosphate-sugar epimerase